MVKAKSVDELGQHKRRDQGYLTYHAVSNRKKPDDFAINQQEILIQTFNTIGGVIAAVGLFYNWNVALRRWYGISEYHVVSVTERTREIGIRKQLERPRTILLQFLMELRRCVSSAASSVLLIAFPISLIIDTFLPTAMPLSCRIRRPACVHHWLE